MGEALASRASRHGWSAAWANIWGAIAGGLIIGGTEALSIRYFGADFVDISVYGLVLFILIVRRRPVRRRERGSARMSGYLDGVLVLLAIMCLRLCRISADRSRPIQSRGGCFAAIGGYARPISAPKLVLSP